MSAIEQTTSTAKRNGGYVLLDFSGVNLLVSVPQTIEGIFTAVETALKTNKPIIAINAVMGIEAMPVSPIPMYGAHDEQDPDTIIHLFGGPEMATITRDGDTESIQFGD